MTYIKGYPDFSQREEAEFTPKLAAAPSHPTQEGTARRILDWAAREIANAPDNEKHNILNKVAYTLGGHVGYGTIEKSNAIDVCDTAISNRPTVADLPKALRTIREAVEDGQEKTLSPNHKGYSPQPELQDPSVSELSKEDQFEALQQFRFQADKPVEKPAAVISIEGHILATRGNIMTVVGQAKAGKSGLLSAILVGALALPGDILDLLGFTVKRNNDGKAVIHIDGEQSRYDHYNGLSKILSRASRRNEPDWFDSYNFRLLDIPDRISSLKLICEILAHRHGGIHLIVLDGGADFVLDTNDLKESNEVVKFFEGLAIEYDCPVVTVLHFNPGTEKGRGHFGSQLERKSETVISVSKDKDSEISTVEGKFLRNSGNIPNIQFNYDVEKGHHVYHGTRSKVSASEAKAERLKSIAETIFPKGKEQFTYTELRKEIEAVTHKAERTAKEYIKTMLLEGIIKYTDESKTSLILQNNHGALPAELPF